MLVALCAEEIDQGLCLGYPFSIAFASVAPLLLPLAPTLRGSWLPICRPLCWSLSEPPVVTHLVVPPSVAVLQGVCFARRSMSCWCQTTRHLTLLRPWVVKCGLLLFMAACSWLPCAGLAGCLSLFL